MRMSLENLLSTTTRAFRSDSHAWIRDKIWSGTPRVRSFCIDRLELTLPNGPDTSEQYTATLRFFKKNISKRALDVPKRLEHAFGHVSELVLT